MVVRPDDRTLRAAMLLLSALLLLAGQLHAQSRAPRQLLVEVRSVDGRPLADAQVLLARAIDDSPRVERTDSAGTARFESPGGAGEYLITVRRDGHRTARRRVLADDGRATVRIVFVLHADSGQTLATVEVRARARRIEPAFVYEIAPGNAEAAAQGTNAAAPPTVARVDELLRNDLLFDAGAAAGLGARETQTQLNGLLFGGGVLPRSAPVAVRGVVADYDAAVTGYAGGRIAAEVARAGDWTVLSGGVTAEVATAVSRDVGGLAAPAAGGAWLADLGGEARVARERIGVSWGVRARAAADPAATLEGASASALEARGLPTSRLDSLLGAARARSLLEGVPSARRAGDLSLATVGRVDLARPRDRTNALVGTLALVDRRSPGTDLLATARLGRVRRGVDGGLQHLWERSTDGFAVWRARTGVTVSDERDGGLVSPVSSAVTVVPVAVDATVGAPALSFGGAPPARARTARSLEHQVEREQRVGASAAHQLKIFVQGRVQDASLGYEAPAGSVAYPTAAAFLDNASARVRIATVDDAHAVVSRIGGGVNDLWRVSPGVTLSAGIRVDHQRLAYRSDGSSSTHEVVDVSPRLGLTWRFQAPREGAGFVTTNLERRQLVPPGVLRAGIGLFSSDFVIDDALRPAGALASTRDATCDLGPGEGALGDGAVAALSPERLTDACRRAGDPRVLASTARPAPGFRPARTLRSTLSAVLRVGPFDVATDAVVGVTGREARLVDRAVPVDAVALLGSDPARPVFASLDSIDAVGGLLRPGRTLEGAAVARALTVQATGRTVAQRYLLRIASRNGSTRWPIRLEYAWGRVTTERTGWDADTDGSPWRVERVAAPQDRRHRIQLEIAHDVARRIDVAFWVRAASGTPFTPLIAGDVNGDGRSANDRFTVASLRDLPGAPTLDELVSTVPNGVRQCLSAIAAGPTAGRCRTPWTVTSALSIRLPLTRSDHSTPPQVAFAIENPLSAFGGWLRTAAADAPIDPVVAQVRAWDRTSERFALARNPDFGRRLPAASVFTGAPRLILTVQFPLSPTIRTQQVDRWFGRRGVGRALPADSVARLFARGVPNVIDDVLEQAEELGLGDRQRAEVQAVRDSLRSALHAAWLAFARTSVQAAVTVGRDSLMAATQEATDEAWALSWQAAQRLVPVLSPLQRSLLEGRVRQLVDAPAPMRMRVLYY